MAAAHVELSGKARRDLKRLGVGDYRIIYRPLDPAEISEVARRRGLPKVGAGYLVTRIVHRRDLERAVASLL